MKFLNDRLVSEAILNEFFPVWVRIKCFNITNYDQKAFGPCYDHIQSLKMET